MRSLSVERARTALFVLCAACTLWLIAQNAMLVLLLPSASWPALVRVIATASRVIVPWAVPLVLVPAAFALGWLTSRGRLGPAVNGGRS